MHEDIVRGNWCINARVVELCALPLMRQVLGCIIFDPHCGRGFVISSHKLFGLRKTSYVCVVEQYGVIVLLLHSARWHPGLPEPHAGAVSKRDDPACSGEGQRLLCLSAVGTLTGLPVNTHSLQHNNIRVRMYIRCVHIIARGLVLSLVAVRT